MANFSYLILFIGGKFQRLSQYTPRTYSGSMRRLRNWTYQNVVDFLKWNGFVLFKQFKGSHEQWKKTDSDTNRDRIVEINFRHDSFPVGTMKTIIARSGIPQGEWIDWAGS